MTDTLKNLEITLGRLQDKFRMTDPSTHEYRDIYDEMQMVAFDIADITGEHIDDIIL